MDNIKDLAIICFNLNADFDKLLNQTPKSKNGLQNKSTIVNIIKAYTE